MFRLLHLSVIITLSSVSLWFAISAQTININGTVVDNGTSAGIASARVRLLEFPASSTTTDANGNFTLTEVTATLPQVTALASGYKIALTGNLLSLNSVAASSEIVVDVFTILGKQMLHMEKRVTGAAEFTSLWETPGLYYVKVQVGNEQRILSSFGSNRNFTIPSPSIRTSESLAKINAAYTIEAGKLGYDSKQTSLSSTTGTGVVIRLSTCSQAPGTFKEVTPTPDSKAGFTGIISVQVDPVRKSDCWFGAADRGVFKSTDYGVTWVHINAPTTVYGTDLNSGRPWFFAIDKNPHRDPSTPPTLYITEGYGVGGPWKSTDGGMTWTQTWHPGVNIFAADGVTKIDPGSDICGVIMCDSSGPNHLIAYMRVQSGTFAAVYETMDGGGKWVIRPDSRLNVGAHSDRPFALDSATWCVIHAPNVYHTTDAGRTWSMASGSMTNMAARSIAIRGSTVYAGSNTTGLYKSTDKGATWKTISTQWCGWVVYSATKIYTCTSPSQAGGGTESVYQATLGSEDTWSSWKAIPGATTVQAGGGCPEDAAITFDGNHYIILAAQSSAGIWRYVEP